MRRPDFRSCSGGLAALLCLSVFLPHLRAATAREELLRYVPEDVAFCLVVQDLRGHAADLAASPFVKSLKDTSIAVGLSASPDLQKLLDADKFLQTTLKVDAEKLRDEILGDALVFAYRPGPAGKPEAEQGLMLLRARDPKLLAELIDRINELQRQSGELKELETLKHEGVTYFRRVDGNKTSSFYMLRGPVLAFTSQEAMLREAIDREAKCGTDEETPVGKQFRLANAQKAMVSLWINPRAFDEDMARKAKDAPVSEATVLKTFLVYWKALDSIVLSLDLQKDLELKLAVRARVEQLPAAARRFLSEGAKPSDLWQRFPPDAMLAVASRFDLAALVEMVQMFLPPEMNNSMKDAVDRGFGATLGHDLITDVLPFVGPDWGMCVVAPSSEDKAWFPQTVFALRVQPGDKKPPVDQTVLGAINFFAGMAVLSHNAKGGEALRLKTVSQGAVEVKYLTGGNLPEGLQPAYALDNGYLVLANSPETIARFRTTPPPSKKPPTDDVPLLRISFKEIRRFAKERREALAAAAAEKNQITKEEAGKKLDGLLDVLQLIDRLELSQRTGAGQGAFTLRVQTSQPLK
jgi:hypothetical protein